MRIVQLGDLGVGALHGEQHVDARVAIRHRKTVELVDNLIMQLQPGHAASSMDLNWRPSREHIGR
jgi:hypothetical protein